MEILKILPRVFIYILKMTAIDSEFCFVTDDILKSMWQLGNVNDAFLTIHKYIPYFKEVFPSCNV